MADYTLPDLPYDYAALEPHISARIMELHHDKHHAAYVAGANTALEKLAEAREANDFSKVNQFSKDLAFELYTTIPEPTGVALLAIGMMGLALRRKVG